MEKLWTIIKTLLLGLVIILGVIAIITIDIILIWIAFMQFNVGLNPTFKPLMLIWLIPIALALALINVIFYELLRWIYWDN